ncbi:hypothetical protein V3C33_10955 [Micrococcaceae bacterium Sec5.7]
MTSPASGRIARVRPHSAASARTAAAAEQFFVANDAAEFGSDAGKVWTVVETPFPGSPANASSAPRPG